MGPKGGGLGPLAQDSAPLWIFTKKTQFLGLEVIPEDEAFLPP